MIKYISNTIITHQNDENMTLRYFNDILRYKQATTSAKDQGKRFRVLVQAVTPTQRQDIAFPNMY